MVWSSSFLPSLAFLAAIFATLPLSTFGFDFMMIIPPDLLALVPEVCQEGNSAEFQEAVGCAFALFSRGCAGIIGKLGEFQNIPSAEEIETCEDIQVPFCNIATACEPCMMEFDALFRCIIRNDPLADSTMIDTIDLFFEETMYDDMVFNETDGNFTDRDFIDGNFTDGNSTSRFLMEMSVADLLDTCALDCA